MRAAEQGRINKIPSQTDASVMMDKAIFMIFVFALFMIFGNL